MLVRLVLIKTTLNLQFILVLGSLSNWSSLVAMKYLNNIELYFYTFSSEKKTSQSFKVSLLSYPLATKYKGCTGFVKLKWKSCLVTPT